MIALESIGVDTAAFQNGEKLYRRGLVSQPIEVENGLRYEVGGSDRAVGDFYPAGRSAVHLRRSGAALPARDGRLAAGRKRRHAQAFPAGKRAGVGTTDVERPEPGHARRRDRPSAGGAAPVRGRSDRSGPVGRAGAAVRRQKYRRPAGLLCQRNGADPVPKVYLPARQYALFPGGRALSDGADELYSSEK